METQKNEKYESLLKKCLINKDEVVEQVWIIYNETIPKTVKQSQVLGEFSQYSKPTRTNVKFIVGSREHIEEKESEEEARPRYEEFKEIIRKDLETILKAVCKPLMCYRNSQQTPQIPVLVAATFASIWAMRKYQDLSPAKMLGTDLKKVEETIDELITHTTDYVLKYYDESDYFLRKIIENLKYFFNIEPNAHEMDMGKAGEFDYRIFENDGIFIITSKERRRNGKQVEIDKAQMLREINNFRDNYVIEMKQQAEIKKKAGNIIEAINSVLENYSGAEVDAVRSKLAWEVSKNYFFNSKDPFESTRVFPLDFTEPYFNECHYNLEDELKRKFYSERNKKISKLGKKNREFFEKNELLDKAGLMVREACLEKKIKEELKKLNEILYRGCQRGIDILEIGSDKE